MSYAIRLRRLLARLAPDVIHTTGFKMHLLAAIAGNFVSHQDEGDDPQVVVREDGSLLVSGWMPADTLLSLIGAAPTGTHSFETVAGFVLHTLHRLPTVGETFDHQGWRFEVVDLDGRRIDKILVSAIEAP